MDVTSRAQTELYRRLFLAGVPERAASLLAGAAFDGERAPYRAPLVRIRSTELLALLDGWLAGDSSSGVGELFDRIYGTEPHVQNWSRPLTAGDGRSSWTPSDWVAAALEAAERVASKERESARGAFADAFRVRVERSFAHRASGQPAVAVAYEAVWDMLVAAPVPTHAPSRDRVIVSHLLQELWNWGGSDRTVTSGRPPAGAALLLFDRATCIRCGVAASGDAAARFLVGECQHEYVTDQDRTRLWGVPPVDFDDLAERILQTAHRVLGVTIRDLTEAVALPDDRRRVGDLLEGISRATHLEVDGSREWRSLGELFLALANQIPPIPTSPYARDRIEHVTRWIEFAQWAPQSASGQHRPTAACLGGQLLTNADSVDVARGQLARCVNLVNRGRCPRCEGPLENSFPAGSRITLCRCIPVCSDCGEAEALEGRGVHSPPRRRVPRGNDEIGAFAFASFGSVSPGDVTGADPGGRWSYRSWPKPVLGVEPPDGMQRLGRVGELKNGSHDETDAVRRRMVGCLLGGAVGDALGAPVEYRTSLDAIHRRFGPRGVQGFQRDKGHDGVFTDDTQMSLFTAEGLIRTRQRWHGSDYNWFTPLERLWGSYLRWVITQGLEPVESGPGAREEYVRTGWLLAAPSMWNSRGPGRTCLRALSADGPGTVESPINGSKGCGGVMRVAPVGFMPFPDMVFVLACDAAALTHGHPSGYLAAGAFAQIFSEINNGATLHDALEAALKRLDAEPASHGVTAALNSAIQLAESGAPSAQKVMALGKGFVAEEALAIAVYCALVAEDFRHGVLLAVNHSGDSDSTGSMAGQLLGALFGVEAIPREWLDAVPAAGVVEQVANDFVDAFYCERVFPNDLYPGW